MYNYIIGLKLILQVLKYALRILVLKLILEYSLRSRDLAHVLPSGSGTMKAIEFDWNNLLSGTLTSVL